MLSQIRIINYKCFKDNTVFLKNTNNVIIGENNAGKSTLLEVIRIVNCAVERLKTKSYIPSEIEYGIGIGYKGVYFDLENLEIETDNLFFQYEEKTIQIIAEFTNKIEVHIYILASNKIFAFAEFEGHNIKTNTKFKEILTERIAILPQISLLKKDEKVIQERNTKKNINTRMSSLHFRNEIMMYKEQETEIYQQYISKITESWKEIALDNIYVENDTIYLYIRDRDFTIEVGKLGSGVQMWIQMLWFFTKNLDATTIVLDEPDVYLHPELQKRIVKIAKEYNKQLIITTHSIEIISEVDKSEIVILDKNKQHTKFVDELIEVQDILDKLGSSQVVNLVKLDKYNRIICVEGEDLGFLNIWHEKLFPESELSFKDVPSYKTGGWGSWDFEKVRAEKILKEREDYSFYYIYDRDYHLNQIIKDREEEGKNKKINLHIWTKKEIENYLINPAVITRVINKAEEKISEKEVIEIIENICEELKMKVIFKYTDEINKNSRRGEELSTIMQRVVEFVDDNWKDFAHKTSIVPGKEVMKRIRNKIKDDYNIQISNDKIAREFKKEEIEQEVIEVIEKIEKKKSF